MRYVVDIYQSEGDPNPSAQEVADALRDALAEGDFTHAPSVMVTRADHDQAIAEGETARRLRRGETVMKYKIRQKVKALESALSEIDNVVGDYTPPEVNEELRRGRNHLEAACTMLEEDE